MDRWSEDGWRMDGMEDRSRIGREQIDRGWTKGGQRVDTDMEDEWMEDGQKIDRRWTEDALMMNGERKKDGRRRD